MFFSNILNVVKSIKLQLNSVDIKSCMESISLMGENIMP